MSTPNQDSPFKKNQLRRHTLLLAGAALAIIVVILFFFFYLRSQRTGVQILDPAQGISIQLNGRAVEPEKNNEGFYLPLYAGKYRLELDKTGYEPFIQDIETVPGSILQIRPAFSLTPKVEQQTGASIDFVRPSADEKSVYYLGDYRQRLYRLDVATQTTVPLTDQPLSGVKDVQWGNNPEVALIVQSDGTYLHEIPRFDFNNQIFKKIAGPELISPTWDPNNEDRLAAAYFTSTGEQSLILTDKLLQNPQRLVFLEGRIPNPKVVWSPNSKYLLLVGRSASVSQQQLWLYTLANGNLTQVSPAGSVATAIFSPDSTHILYQVGTGSTTQLHLYDIGTNNEGSLTSTAELSKTTWKDATHFYEPDPHGGILERSFDGSSTHIAVSLPKNESILTMLYFPSSANLIVSTAQAVYTVSLGKQE